MTRYERTMDIIDSHRSGLVEQLADDLVVINQGRLVTSGAIDELRQTTTLVRTDADDRLGEVLRAGGGTVQPGPDRGLIVEGLAIDVIGDLAFHAGIAVHELSPHSGSLEELTAAVRNLWRELSAR